MSTDAPRPPAQASPRRARRRHDDLNRRSRRLNPLKHGLRTAELVLETENAGEYEALLGALIDEHAPRGPTEAHLVDELAGIMWRKRRHRRAETAVFRDADAGPVGDGGRKEVFLDTGIERLAMAPGYTAEGEEAVSPTYRRGEQGGAVVRALEILRKGNANALAEAFEVLDPATRDLWQARGEKRHRYWELDYWDVGWYEEDGSERAALAGWLDNLYFHHLREPYMLARIKKEEQAGGRDAPDAPAHGGSSEKRLVTLARYEADLDRKFERVLAMLLMLQQSRPVAVDASASTARVAEPRAGREPPA